MSENLSITNKPWFQDWQERKWFATSFEKLIDISFSIRERLHYAKMMLRCQVFFVSFFYLFIFSFAEAHQGSSFESPAIECV